MMKIGMFMMKKKVLPLIVAGMLSAPFANASSLSYGLESADMTASGVSFTGLAYGIGLTLDITDEVSATASYTNGDLTYQSITADFSGTTIGLRYSFDVSDDVDVYLGATNSNVKVDFSASGYTASATDSGTAISVGIIANISDTSDFTLGVTSSDGDTSTKAGVSFEVFEDMDMNLSITNGDGFTAYGFGLTENF